MQKGIRLEVINSNTKGKNNMKACIYIRVSTQRQNVSGLGLEAQRKICMDYINKSGKEYVTEFKDVESGKSRTREGLWRAVDYCKENRCELVIAKLDRLARDVEFTFRVINTGIDIYFCDMPMINTMFLGTQAALAQYERELISDRTRKALAAKKQRGEQTGGTKSLWGKNTGTDRNKAMTIARQVSATNRRAAARNNPSNKAFREFMEDWQEIHGRITDATDWQAIADKLNARGKTTSSGLPFDKNRARAMYASMLKIYA